MALDLSSIGTNYYIITKLFSYKKKPFDKYTLNLSKFDNVLGAVMNLVFFMDKFFV